MGDFPGGPVVKSPPCNAGEVGLIPGQRTKISHAKEQWSPSVSTKESMCCMQWKILHDATKALHSQISKIYMQKNSNMVSPRNWEVTNYSLFIWTSGAKKNTVCICVNTKLES